MKLRLKHSALLIVPAALLVPQFAFAASGINGMMDFFTELIKNGMTLVGAALALAGLVALGMGVWDIIQHFKPENRDNPDQKSRAVAGIVKFVMGGLLATGAYQAISNDETFTTAIEAPDNGAVVAYAAPADAVDLGTLVSA